VADDDYYIPAHPQRTDAAPARSQTASRSAPSAISCAAVSRSAVLVAPGEPGPR